MEREVLEEGKCRMANEIYNFMMDFMSSAVFFRGGILISFTLAGNHIC